MEILASTDIRYMLYQIMPILIADPIYTYIMLRITKIYIARMILDDELSMYI